MQNGLIKRVVTWQLVAAGSVFKLLGVKDLGVSNDYPNRKNAASTYRVDGWTNWHGGSMMVGILMLLILNSLSLGPVSF